MPDLQRQWIGGRGRGTGGLGGDLPVGAPDLSPQTNPQATPQAEAPSGFGVSKF